MKKLILLLSVFAIVFTSCGSDDEGSSQDSLIGSWKYSAYLEDGVSQALEPCEELGTIVVSSNGTYVAKDYYDYGTGCEIDYTGSGTWENLGSSMYRITEDGETDDIQIGFSGNTMYFEEVYQGVTYRDVYTKQ